MNDLAYERALEQKIDELMNGEYSPFLACNLQETIDNMSEVDLGILAHYVTSIADAGMAGQFLRAKSVNFWARLAKTEAESQLESECQNCYGLGCNQCNDKGE